MAYLERPLVEKVDLGVDPNSHQQKKIFKGKIMMVKRPFLILFSFLEKYQNVIES